MLDLSHHNLSTITGRRTAELFASSMRDNPLMGTGLFTTRGTHARLADSLNRLGQLKFGLSKFAQPSLNQSPKLRTDPYGNVIVVGGEHTFPAEGAMRLSSGTGAFIRHLHRQIILATSMLEYMGCLVYEAEDTDPRVCSIAMQLLLAICERRNEHLNETIKSLFTTALFGSEYTGANIAYLATVTHRIDQIEEGAEPQTSPLDPLLDHYVPAYRILELLTESGSIEVDNEANPPRVILSPEAIQAIAARFENAEATQERFDGAHEVELATLEDPYTLASLMKQAASNQVVAVEQQTPAQGNEGSRFDALDLDDPKPKPTPQDVQTRTGRMGFLNDILDEASTRLLREISILTSAKPVIRHLANRDPIIRKAAILRIKEFGTVDDELASLSSMLDDPNETVQIATILALRESRSVDAVKGLLNLLSKTSGNRNILLTIKTTIIEIARKADASSKAEILSLLAAKKEQTPSLTPSIDRICSAINKAK